MTTKAVLDLIGFPIGMPGSLECRFQKGTFKADGTWVDDGSRPLKPTPRNPHRSKHRVVLGPGQDINVAMRWTKVHLNKMGYLSPDMGLIHKVADHEWDADVLSARKDRLVVKRPELQLVVRALGFDIEGRGELAVGLGKATIGPEEAVLTQKSSLLLKPGDDVEELFEALDRLAERTGYLPLVSEDIDLVRFMLEVLWGGFDEVKVLSLPYYETFDERVGQAEDFIEVVN